VGKTCTADLRAAPQICWDLPRSGRRPTVVDTEAYILVFKDEIVHPAKTCLNVVIFGQLFRSEFHLVFVRDLDLDILKPWLFLLHITVTMSFPL